MFHQESTDRENTITNLNNPVENDDELPEGLSLFDDDDEDEYDEDYELEDDESHSAGGLEGSSDGLVEMTLFVEYTALIHEEGMMHPDPHGVKLKENLFHTM